MNWRMKSATAGPGQATHPSPIKKRRWRSRGSSASRSCSWRMKSTCWRSDLTGSSSRKPVRLIQAGHGGASEDAGEHPGRRLGDLLGDPERQRHPGVDRAAEGDHGVDPLAAAVGGRLVTEHPALRVAAEVDVAPGRLADPVDRVGRRRPRGRRGRARARPPRARGSRSRPPRGRRRARAGPRPRSRPARRRRRRRRASSAAPAGPARPAARRRSSGAAGRSRPSAATSYGDGSSPVSRPPNRATSKAF